MARTVCGSTRCECDHTTCDLGWVTVLKALPNGTGTAEADAKCPTCFPVPTPSISTGRSVPPVQRGDGYIDARSAAAGDR